MRIYVCGGMTGYPDKNIPAFKAAANELFALGFDVVSPHEVEDPDDLLTWEDYMRIGITTLMTCQGVALLPDWNMSSGATLEHHIAEKLHFDIRDLAEWLDPTQRLQ